MKAYIKKYKEYTNESANYPDLPPDIISLVKDCFMSIADDISVRFKHNKISVNKNDTIFGIQVNITPKVIWFKDAKNAADLSDKMVADIESCIHLCSGYNDMEIVFVRIIHTPGLPSGTGIILRIKIFQDILIIKRHIVLIDLVILLKL